VDHQLRAGAQKRDRVDAVVGAEALVLVGEQQVEKARIDIVARRRQPPTAFRRGVRSQQPAVAIDHERREGEPLAQRRRPKRHDPVTKAGDCRNHCD
jgi:hypothetical protein